VNEFARLGLAGAQLTVEGADVGGQAAQLGAQDLLGDWLPGVHAQAAAPAGLAQRAQAAEYLPQIVGGARIRALTVFTAAVRAVVACSRPAGRGLLSGQKRRPRPGHQWGLFHGHGQPMGRLGNEW
jgi:hypothetical protein